MLDLFVSFYLRIVFSSAKIAHYFQLGQGPTYAIIFVYTSREGGTTGFEFSTYRETSIWSLVIMQSQLSYDETPLTFCMQKDDPCTWDECLRRLNNVNLSVDLQLDERMEVLKFYLTSSANREELDIILIKIEEVMLRHLQESSKLKNYDSFLIVYSGLIYYIRQFSYQELEQFPWLKNEPLTDGLIVHIVESLCIIGQNLGWVALDILRKQPAMLDNASNIVFNLEMHIVDTYYKHAMHLKQGLDQALLSNKKAELMLKIDTLLKQMETRINVFRDNVSKKNIIMPGNCVFCLDHMLFQSALERAHLAIKSESVDVADTLIKQCDGMQTKYEHPPMRSSFEALKNARYKLYIELEERLFAELEVKPSPKKSAPPPKVKKHVRDHKTSSKTYVSPDIVVPANIAIPAPDVCHQLVGNDMVAGGRLETPLPQKKDNIDARPTHKEREKERKRLKKIEKIKASTAAINNAIREFVDYVEQSPRCYIGHPELLELFQLISANFNNSLCDGYLFGSANYKTSPSDLDILLPNIKSDRDKENVKALIGLFEQQGGKKIAAYNKNNLNITKMTWSNWEIDFISFEDTYLAHSNMLDFTVGAMYFDLRQLKMIAIKSSQPFDALHNKELITTIDALTSFTEDPTRIFRAIRLIVMEGFHFSTACVNAINHAFSNNKNLFKNMSRGKLNYQLSLLCKLGPEAEYKNNERKSIEILRELGLVSKLKDVLSERRDVSAQRFMHAFTGTFSTPLRPQALPWHPRSNTTSLSHAGFFKPTRSNSIACKSTTTCSSSQGKRSSLRTT